MKLKKIFITCVIFIIFPYNLAYAYIDPSFALIAFQWVIAGIASVYAIVVTKPLRFIKKFFSKDTEQQKKNSDQDNKKSDNKQ
tara:strand:- start:240 stop:488 length:249 start_codon:yes stop_codon:yes gene_type:complete